jgi:hypothetical protein
MIWKSSAIKNPSKAAGVFDCVLRAFLLMPFEIGTAVEWIGSVKDTVIIIGGIFIFGEGYGNFTAAFPIGR